MLKLNISQRVAVIFIVITLFILFAFYISLQEVKSQLIKNKKSELMKNTRLASTIVEAVFDSSVKKYLKGISQTHLNMAQFYYHQHLEGKLSIKEVKKKIEEHLLSHKVGESGYVVALDISKGKENIILAVHPFEKGKDISSFSFAQKMYEMKTGYIELDWKNPKDQQAREKVAYMSYFEPLEWIISIAPYKNEFHSIIGSNIFQTYLGQIERSKKEGSYFSVFDINGTMIYHPHLSGKNLLALQDTKTGEFFIKNLLTKIKASATNENIEGWLEYSFTRRGEDIGPASDKIFYYIYLPAYDWVVINIINKDEIVAPHTTLQKRFLYIGIFILLGIIFIALLASAYIKKRLSNLILGAKAISNDDFSHLIKREHYDEIGDVEEAFGTATIKISQLLEKQKQHALELESKVKERTKELRSKNKQLETLSTTDRLTGAFNRHKIDEVLSFEISRASRNFKDFGIILMDIDKFKNINDTYGHLVGDKILCEIADLLKQNTRKVDFIGRWGGEEFLIFCPDTHKEGIKKLADNLKSEIENFSFSEVDKVTASFGVTHLRQIDTMETLLKRADDALYYAKENGRNRVEVN